MTEDNHIEIPAALSNLRKRLKGDAWKEESIPRVDRELLNEFDEQISRDRRLEERCGPAQHANLMNQCWAISKATGKLAAACQQGEPGEEALLEIIQWIEDGFSGSTKQGYMSALRNIAKDTEGDCPEHIEAISPSDYNEDRGTEAPLPSEVVEWNEVLHISDVGAYNSRDEALIQFCWDVGPRPMVQLNDLQRKNLTFCGDHVVVHYENDPDGKRDATGVLVSPAFPALKKWVFDDHPVHADPEEEMTPETYIWVQLDKNVKLQSAANRFKVIGKRVDLDKEISAQHFRRSSASVLARSPEMNRRDIRKRYHWGIESPAPRHYLAMHTRATQIATARARGHDPSTLKREPNVAPVKCPHEGCKKWTTRGRDECIWCDGELPDDDSAVVSPVRRPGASETDDLRHLVASRLISADELRTIRKYLPAIRATPNIKEEISQWIRMLDYVEDDDDPVTALLPGVGLLSPIQRGVSSVRSLWDGLKLASDDWSHPNTDIAKAAVGTSLPTIALIVLLVSAAASDPTVSEGLVSLSAVIGVATGLSFVVSAIREATEAALSV